MTPAPPLRTSRPRPDVDAQRNGPPAARDAGPRRGPDDTESSSQIERMVTTMRRLGVLLTQAHLWWTDLPRRSAKVDRDRGDALSTVVITLGLVVIAVAVIIILRGKATSIAQHICTSADPTTCQ